MDFAIFVVVPATIFLASIIGVLFYVIREFLWMRAYNHGFACASRNPNDDADFTWRANRFYRLERNRRAFILGARHAKGY